MGRQQFTKEETKIAVGVFYEVLYSVVPEHRLNDCYLAVKRNRTTTFPLAPEEMCAAWNEIRQSEMHKQNPTKQLTHGFCGKCNNTNTELIRDEHGRIKGGRPCTH